MIIWCDEQGGLLPNTIFLLFFVSLFLFTFVSWHSHLYSVYDSFEIIYTRETLKMMATEQMHNGEPIFDWIHGE